MKYLCEIKKQLKKKQKSSFAKTRWSLAYKNERSCKKCQDFDFTIKKKVLKLTFRQAQKLLKMKFKNIKEKKYTLLIS